mgnify:FL=1
MNLGDFQEIEPIYNLEFDDFWKPQNLKSELQNVSSKYIVAKENGEIVGFAGIWYSVDDAHITNIVVRKSYRNKGIGSLLLEKLIELAKTKTSLTLEVNTKNEIAQKLYLKYGFKNLGIRKKYYDGIEDAYIMTLYF